MSLVAPELGAWLVFTHTGCLIYRLHHTPGNVSFEECLLGQIAEGGGLGC